MVHAIYLAIKLDVGFGFRWGDEGSGGSKGANFMGSEDQVFSPEFRKKHAIPENFDLGGFVDASRLRVTFDDFRNRLKNEHFKGFIATQRSMRSWLDDGLLPSKQFGLRDAFGMIEFSSAVQAAIDAAKEVPLGGSVCALHLRGGDVIFGKYRKAAAYQRKAIAAPLAKSVISKMREGGAEVLLFGQDTALLEYFKKSCGVTLVKDVQSERFDLDAAQSMFEITLMARCELIVAGTSGFASLASDIGVGSKRGVSRIYTSEEQVDIIVGDLSRNRGDYSDLQLSFAYSNAYLLGRPTLPPEKAEALLLAGAEVDPDNELFPIMRAADCFRCLRFKEGDEILRELVERQLRECGSFSKISALKVFSSSYSGSSPFPGEYGSFSEAAASGASYAHLFMCFVKHHNRVKLSRDEVDALLEGSRQHGGAVHQAVEYLKLAGAAA